MIKLIPEKKDFSAQCYGCMSGVNCYEIVVRTDHDRSYPFVLTLCKDCLKELQKQMKEQIND